MLSFGENYILIESIPLRCCGLNRFSYFPRYNIKNAGPQNMSSAKRTPGVGHSIFINNSRTFNRRAYILLNIINRTYYLNDTAYTSTIIIDIDESNSTIFLGFFFLLRVLFLSGSNTQVAKIAEGSSPRLEVFGTSVKPLIRTL